MSEVTRLKAEALKTYEDSLAAITRQIPFIDAVHDLARYWEELTGQKCKPYITESRCTLRLHMGTLMANGRYPSRHEHVSLMIERGDELLVDSGLVGFDSFRESLDQWTNDFSWGKWDVSTLHLYFSHGGNCTYEQVGEQVVVNPIYEARCS